MGFLLVTKVGMHAPNARVLAELAQGFLRGVVASNRVTIRFARREGRPIPPLYSSGVVYDREPWAGQFEEFADLTTVLHRGWGDCDDLCAWRVAELLEGGEPAADIRVYWRISRTGQKKMHIQVRRGVCAADGALLQVVPPGKTYIRPDGKRAAVRTCCPGCQRFNTGKIEDPSRFMGL